MNFLTGINRFLGFINDNWTSILVMIGLIIAIVKKIIDYFSKSTNEKIAIAKYCIKEGLLKMITDAELDYENWDNAGSIKRSQVISRIYEEYPILEKVANQESLISWIDEQIDNSLVILRDTISKNMDEPAKEEVIKLDSK